MPLSILRASAVVLPACIMGVTLADEPLKVYDVNGVAIGRLGPNVTVELTVEGQHYMVPLTAERLGDHRLQSTTTLDFLSPNPYFRDTKCTGQAYALFPGSFGMPLAFVEVRSSGKLMLRPAGAEARNRTMHSYQDAHGKCIAPWGGEGPAAWVPMSDPIDITGQFPRPFIVR